MKKLIVCLDGTWNDPEGMASTNVLQFMRALTPKDSKGFHQVVYYDRGVGTDNWWDKIVGGIAGKGLNRNVLEAYRWIANNYDLPPSNTKGEWDQVYLLGFSRGAYTARSLAGLINTLGILQKRHVGKLDLGWQYYKAPKEEKASNPFLNTDARKTTRPATIKFIGVFDTVGSLGVPIRPLRDFNAKKYQFHDVKLSHAIENAFQALAGHERRKDFAPAIWEKPKGWKGTLEQRWFRGGHSDVGGGYPEHGLSDEALEWMVEKAEVCGLNFDHDFIKDYKTWPDPAKKKHDETERKWYWRFRRKPRNPEKDPSRGLDFFRTFFDNL